MLSLLPERADGFRLSPSARLARVTCRDGLMSRQTKKYSSLCALCLCGKPKFWSLLGYAVFFFKDFGSDFDIFFDDAGGLIVLFPDVIHV